MRLLLPKTLFLLLLSLMIGCSTTKETQRQEIYASGEKEINVGYGKTKSKNKLGAVESVEPDNPNLSLADYLKRVPGISVRGSGDNATIRVRGGISSSGLSQEPLFVLDNAPIGKSYQNLVNMVDINDIKRVSVLKDISSTNIYGVNGSNGVILITTKRDNYKKPSKKKKKKKEAKAAKAEEKEAAKG
ncbi:MAG: TonB-dependent receptor plug domain-containing protein [Bacteroidota bacterium]